MEGGSTGLRERETLARRGGRKGQDWSSVPVNNVDAGRWDPRRLGVAGLPSLRGREAVGPQ